MSLEDKLALALLNFAAGRTSYRGNTAIAGRSATARHTVFVNWPRIA